MYDGVSGIGIGIGRVRRGGKYGVGFGPTPPTLAALRRRSAVVRRDTTPSGPVAVVVALGAAHAPGAENAAAHLYEVVPVVPFAVQDREEAPLGANERPLCLNSFGGIWCEPLALSFDYAQSDPNPLGDESRFLGLFNEVVDIGRGCPSSSYPCAGVCCQCPGGTLTFLRGLEAGVVTSGSSWTNVNALLDIVSKGCKVRENLNFTAF